MTVGLDLLMVALAAMGAFAAWQYVRRRDLDREHHIRSYVFPSGVLETFSRSYPQLEPKDVQLAARALRQFFLVHKRAGGQLVAMPSKVADALWHAFILDTRAYRAFCQRAFGGYFHHIPEGSVMRAADKDRMATWRTWRLACLEENIHPLKATRLPLLFALDAKLNTPGAVVYDPSSFRKPASADGRGGGGCGGSGSDNGCGGGCGGD
ncbi:glycine-rich domain-containing protein [Ramlibacter pallidus]|uniref:DUF4760 domain-containing protein n=1 Tax=Ramlibacter pallidus TaxID=2780087 RepID=A0ABR9S3B9_9BURK|nr:hypothetical protein [Ramlibacter pallidus]MBE7368004.1 hypothetical protein [Ramlibacter pallidus]